MSSNEDEYVDDYGQRRSKTRKVARACDRCRRRKSRCDEPPDGKCSACVNSGLECTYSVPSYVEELESRLERSEATIRKLRANFAASVHTPPSSPDQLRAHASLKLMQHAVRALGRPQPPPRPEDLLHAEIARKLESLSIGTSVHVPGRRFNGKSSGAALIKAAIDLKEGYAPSIQEERQPWTSRRMQYWKFKPWAAPHSLLSKTAASYSAPLRFPPPQLLERLVDAYFTHMNIFLPLLHRPTFERGIREGMHLQGNVGEPGGFGATVLLVCAIGSRYVQEGYSPAAHGVWYEGDGPADEILQLACGWEWFDQVPPVGNRLFGQATLYDLQYYCLAVLFLEGSSTPQAVWTFVGLGIRLAQDVGVHRRKNMVECPTVEGELWKRAFWVLIYMDRMVSSGMGRSCAVHFDDYDIEPPIECDDEYWEDPYHPFEQPEGLPSKIAFFNTLLRLNHILAFSLKLLYSLTKMRIGLGIDDMWEENIVAELNSAVNEWREEIPEHLRWDPARDDPVFFDQSVALHCSHSQLQIIIHRPFIPMVRKSAPTALPSLAICTRAARTCANMVDIQRQRKGSVPVFFNLHSVFSAGIILLLNMWGGKRTGRVLDPSWEIANVHKCMEVIKLCEHRWQSAGQFWDILSELASIGQLPLAGKNVNATESVNPRKRPLALPLHSSALYPRCTAGPSDPRFLPPPDSFAGGKGVESEAAPMEASVFAPPPPDAWYPPEDPFASLGGAPSGSELEEMMNWINSDGIAMWTNAPTGFEVDDWGTYISNLSEITQGQQQMQGDIGSNY